MKNIKLFIFTLFISAATLAPVARAHAVQHPFIFAGNLATDCDVGPGEELNRDNCKIVDYIVIAINFLTAAAGLAIVASIMIAGYQYMTARDNSGQIEAARKRIVWALIALGILVFGFAGLNFIVPGGVL